MVSVKPTGVLLKSILIAVPIAGVLAWPLVAHRVELGSKAKEFALVDDLTQLGVVRAYLRDQISQPALHSSTGTRMEVLYFDRRSAFLCSIDEPQQCDEHEFRSVKRQGALVDAVDISVPIELRRLLDHTTLTRTYNSDPRSDGVNYIGAGEKLPFSKGQRECTDGPRPRLIRISRAVEHKPSNLAIALVSNVFCDQSVGLGVVKFTREGTAWRVDNDSRDAP